MKLEFDDCVLYQDVLATKALTRSSPNWATFRLRLFREPGWQSVAIATQMPFEGISLTNAAEGIAASIWQEFLAEHDEPPIFIRHYPVSLMENAIPWMRVRLMVGDGPYVLTLAEDGVGGWWPTDLAEVQELVGQELDPYRDPVSQIPPAPEST
jgi:hypothetical protein